MFRNLQIEWMKIRNYRVFQVFSILYMAGILLIIFIFYKIYMSLTAAVQQAVTGNQNSEGSDLFQFFYAGNIWSTVGFSTSFLLYLPGMIIISLFTNEVNFKTHRQNIIDGWKRETFIYSKISLIFCMTIVITIMNFFATMIMFLVTDQPVSFTGISVLGLIFVQTFVYLMFALLLATLFRRSGVAIIIFFVYGLILEMILMLGLYKIYPPLMHLLPLQAADSLVPLPVAKDFNRNIPDTWVLLVTALTYAGLYIWLTVRKYKYDDL